MKNKSALDILDDLIIGDLSPGRVIRSRIKKLRFDSKKIFLK